MTREDIIAWAREADLIDDTYASDWYVYQLERFAALVAAASAAKEREACAKVCESLEGCSQYFPHVPDYIRARGETK